MTRPSSPAASAALLATIDELVSEYVDKASAGRVLDAVARSRIHVEDGLRVVGHLPPEDEYVSLIAGLARQELDLSLRSNTAKVSQR
jgi:hypothetical protein